MNRGIIAIDADGVMLDYNIAFKEVYERAFNVTLTLHDAQAFHATNMWGLKPFTEQEKKEFYRQSHDYAIWTKMPAIPGAVEAVNQLVEMGFEIVCVTSMPPQYEQDRLKNLQNLGFKINKIIATNRIGKENPKKKPIEVLNPLYFLDDLVKNFQDIQCDTKLVYIERNYTEKPNKVKGDIDIKFDLMGSSIQEFVDYIITNDLKKESGKSNTYSKIKM